MSYDEQFNAWWERHRDPLSDKRDVAKDAWDEAHKQRDEESNLIIGKGFWGRAVSNVSSENKELKERLAFLIKDFKEALKMIDAEWAAGATDEWCDEVRRKHGLED